MTQTQSQEIQFDPSIWVDNHGSYLYSFALSRVRDGSTAEDIVQDTFLAAIQAYDSFEGKANERTWLTGILKHKIVDHFRKTSREVELTDEESDMSSYNYLFREDGVWKGHWTAEVRPIVWQGDPGALLEESEFCGILDHCLDELPNRIAKVFAMREMHGLEADEICEAFKISPNNFWVMMHRARLHLRRCIDFNWFRKREGNC